MQPCVTLPTLGVADPERALTFCPDGLGLPTKGIVGSEFEHGRVAFFGRHGEPVLGLWPCDDQAWECELPRDGWGRGAVAIGHNVASREQVDRVIDQARRAGARVIKPARDTVWGGYMGYFRDPDDHLWEVARNLNLPLTD